MPKMPKNVYKARLLFIVKLVNLILFFGSHCCMLPEVPCLVNKDFPIKNYKIQRQDESSRINISHIFIFIFIYLFFSLIFEYSSSNITLELFQSSNYSNNSSTRPSTTLEPPLPVFCEIIHAIQPASSSKQRCIVET